MSALVSAILPFAQLPVVDRQRRALPYPVRYVAKRFGLSHATARTVAAAAFRWEARL